MRHARAESISKLSYRPKFLHYYREAILPGWLPVARRPHATLLMGHLNLTHHEAFMPLLQRMATEDIGTVVMEAFARIEATEVTAQATAQMSPEDLKVVIDAAIREAGGGGKPRRQPGHRRGGMACPARRRRQR